MSKTGGKLLLGPQCCLNNDRSALMRALKKSQNLIKVKKIMTIFDTICIQAVSTLAQAGLIHNQRLPN